MREMHIFIDSNILMQYRSPQEVDWLTEFEADGVILLLAPQVIRELDELKESDKRRKKRRARNVLKRISDLLGDGIPARVRDKVELRYLHQESRIDFESHGLSQASKDDNILASVLEYKEQNPNREILILTADLGFTLKARARSLPVATLDDRYKLPEEPDRVEEENRKLQGEIRKLKSRMPRLELQFAATRSNHIKAKVEPFEPLADEQFLCHLHEEEKVYPLIEWPEESKLVERPTHKSELDDNGRIVTSPQKIILAAVSIQGDEKLLTRAQIDEYNEEMRAYYGKYRNFIRKFHRYEHESQLIIALELCLANSGTCPAEGIDIEIAQENAGCILSHDTDNIDLQMPTRPKPPPKPGEEGIRGQNRSSGGYTFMQGSPVEHLHDIINPPNVTASSSTGEVKYSIRKLKHSNHETLPLIIHFHSYDKARSLQLNVTLTADNIPDKQGSRFHIIVEKDQPRQQQPLT